MKYTPEQVNKLSRDMCLYSNKCTQDCYMLNCETTWAAERLLKHGWTKPDSTSLEYTIDQYRSVLAKAADMKAAIDELQEMTRKGIDSWAEFGKALDAVYEARDAYYKLQLDISIKYFTPNFY